MASSSKSSVLPLVVLDLDGVLITRYFEGKLPEGKSILPHVTQSKVEKFLVTRRPGLDTFLKMLFAKYQVAIYTSITKYNAITNCELLFTKDQMNSLLFMWDRSYTEPDPDIDSDPKVNKWDTIKPLSKIYEKFPQYGPHNTVICDDSKSKHRHNDQINIVYVDKFDPLTEEGSDPRYLDKLYQMIVKRIEELKDLKNLEKEPKSSKDVLLDPLNPEKLFNDWVETRTNQSNSSSKSAALFLPLSNK